MPSALRLLEPGRPGSIESLLSEAAKDIERGAHLGESRRRRGSAGQLPIAELRLIEVGEDPGLLPSLLRRIAARLEERLMNRRAVVAGLIYPVILVHVAILAAAAPLVVSGLGPFLSSVVPKFLLLWLVALAVSLSITVAASRPDGRRRLVDAAGQLPVVGRAVRARAFSECAYCVGVALSAGLPMPESIRLGGEASCWAPLGFVVISGYVGLLTFPGGRHSLRGKVLSSSPWRLPPRAARNRAKRSPRSGTWHRSCSVRS